MNNQTLKLLPSIDGTKKATGVFALGDIMYIIGSISEAVIESSDIKTVNFMLTEVNFYMIETLAQNIIKLNKLNIEVNLYYPDQDTIKSYMGKCIGVMCNVVPDMTSEKVIVVDTNNTKGNVYSYSYIIRVNGKTIYFAGNNTEVEPCIRMMGNRIDEWYQSISNIEELSKDYTFKPFLDKIISLDVEGE